MQSFEEGTTMRAVEKLISEQSKSIYKPPPSHLQTIEMAIDMNVISLKDGGRFAMSWIAGTNPKALRSTYQRQQIYSVDVTEVCEEMIESLRMKEDKLSFRILFRLCFGTIHIYAEQKTIPNLFPDVTLNFVCFNTFVMKQYSRKRLSSTVADNSNSKRICLDSSDDLDISSLLMESEIFNDYTEDKFKFPNELGHNISYKKNKNTSTCIEINKITIRHVSWDNPMPEEEDEFGDASQDERSILLSGLNETMESSRKSSSQKRKPCYNTPECSPFKRPCLMNESNESVDDFRYDSSVYNDTLSEAGFDSMNQTIQDSDKNITDVNDNDLTQINFESTRCFPDQESSVQEVTENIVDHYALEDSNDIPLPDLLQNYINCTDDDNIIDNTSRIDSPISNLSLNEIPKSITPTDRKRKRPQILIDTYTKIQKIDCENVWKHCFDINEQEHLASPKDYRKPIIFNKRITSRRVQNDKLLSCFNKNVKLRLQQNHNYNRQLILEDILGDEFDEFKHLFKIKISFGESFGRRRSKIKENISNCQQFDDQNKNFVDNNNNNASCSTINNYNNNLQFEEQQNHLQVETSGYNRLETERNGLKLKCPLHEIDPFAISFDFPVEAGHQRSEWGKEGIMTKLLFAWIAEDPVVNMKSIIVGANRINAALAFHTLLDLSGQQYIEIIKDETNSIESIKMGPEMIKKINKSCA